jgi:CheY-like chemotaxis protein
MKITEASILIVDDEPDLVEIFTAWLEVAHCKKVIGAESGKAALAMFELTCVDLLVTDINMPVMDGIALIRAISKAGYSMPIIIFVSGQTSNETELRQLGVRTFLSKPVRRTEFLAAIEDALAIRLEQRFS